MTNNQLKSTIVLLVFCIVFSSILFLGYIVYAQSNLPVEIEERGSNNRINNTSNNSILDEPISEEPLEVSLEVNLEPIFQLSPLPQDIKEMIFGVSFKSTAPIEIEDLSYIQVTYVDMEGNDQLGELIAHKDVAQDLVDIFKELYAASFPISQMQLVDYFNASDDESMEANNTSCFNTRTMTLNDKEWSLHAYGVAIDINPVQNPFIYEEIILPFKGKNYLNRELYTKGMILKDGPVYKAFISRGWTWGGDWETLKDYQHFEKEIVNDRSE